MDFGTITTTFALNTSLPKVPRLLGDVYRTLIAVFFVVWLAWPKEGGEKSEPLTALSEAVAWCGVADTSWLVSLSSWIDQRSQVLSLIAAVVLVASLAAMYLAPLGRAASTFLLAVLLVAQTGGNVLAEVVAPLAVILVALLALGILSATLGNGTIARDVKDKMGYVTVGALLALTAVLAPVMWFLSEDRPERRISGSKYDPIHVHVAGGRGPSGSISSGRLAA